MDVRVCSEIVRKNLRLAFSLSALLCGGLLLLASMLFPWAGLSAQDAGKPVEMLLPFLGVVLMSAVFLPEQEPAIRESVSSRRIGLGTVQRFRVLIALVLLTLFVSGYCLFLRWNECDVTGYLIWGGIASAFFLGSITYFVAEVSGNPINGILVAVIYYISNYGWKKQLGVFYLFRMSSGNFSGKIWLFLCGLLLLLFAFAVAGQRKRHGRLRV